MVLSNKKLKQKLRTLLAESLAASESGNPSKDVDDFDHDLQNLKNQISATRSRKSKPPKRSVKQELKPEGEDADLGGLNKEQQQEEEEEDKKRKREGDGVDENKAPDKKKSRKNKTKKWWRERVWKKKRKEGADEKEGDKDVKVAEPVANEESEENTKRVYIGGIPYYAMEDDIRSFFEGCGTVTEIDCMKFPESGKFRGIAILTFKTDAAAKRALALDGADMGGFYLKIRPFKGNRIQKPDFAPNIVEGYNRVYVGNLSWEITEDDLKNLFSDCSIASLRWGMDKETDEFKGYAHVDFNDSPSLAIALKLDQQVVCGRPVRIRCAVPNKSVESFSSSKSADERADNGKATSGSEKKTRQRRSESANEQVDNGETTPNTGKKKRRTCYECGVPGHLSSSCPRKRATMTADTTEADS